MKVPVLILALSVVSTAALAGKTCDDLKAEIAAKIDANHVSGYTLEIVATDQAGERKVVGSCEGGTKKIVYQRQGATPAKDKTASAGSEQK
jgi:hypothetical protein